MESIRERRESWENQTTANTSYELCESLTEVSHVVYRGATGTQSPLLRASVKYFDTGIGDKYPTGKIPR